MSAHAIDGGKRRTPLQKTLFLVVVALALFLLPYLFPVKPSIGLSYLAGYSNRVAIVILVVGAALFAFFTKGEFATIETQDSHLPVWTLTAALVITTLLCAVQRHSTLHTSPGMGGLYHLDRQQTLAAGQTLYRGFEFMYGPLLICPGVWMAQLFHTSQVNGYYAWLLVQWLVGVVMLWVVVRLIDLPMRFRPLFFALMLLAHLPEIADEGSNYTTFRPHVAILLALLVYAVWKRTGSAWKTSAMAVLAVGLGLAVSMEQAIGLEFGLAAYLVLLAWWNREKFAWSAVALFFLGSATCIGLAARSGMFISFKAWTAGGLYFPLVPSTNNLLRLLPYIVAGCLFYRTLLRRQFDSVAIPLTLVGVPMLPYALGRCDFSHIGGATPLFYLGVAGIFAMPSIRRWWIPLFLGVGLVLTYMFNNIGALDRETWRVERHFGLIVADPLPQVRIVPVAHPPATDDIAPIPESDLPCDRTYFSPTLIPSPLSPFRPSCLDRGYYRGIEDNVISPESITRKVDEMRQRPNEPLLIQNMPFALLFRTGETNMNTVHPLEMALVAPPVRNTPVNFDPIRSYIETHYTPGPLVVRNRLQIWYPIATGQK